MISKNKHSKKYWLYLEPYTFIFRGKTSAVIYNSLSSDFIKVDYSYRIKKVLNEISKPDNLYVIQITENDLNDVNLKKFISDIRDSFSGDLISQTSLIKPIVIPPILNLQMSVKNLQKDPELSLEQSLPDQLNEFSFYITGKCKQTCNYCNDYSKQFSFCRKSNKELDLKDISKVLHQASGSRISKVNILGGDIFTYKERIALLDILQNYTFKKVFYSHINNLDTIKAKEILIQKGAELNILTNSIIDEKYLEETLKTLKGFFSQIKWTFIINNETEYTYFESIISKFKLSNHIIKPFLHNSNIDFFKENVFLEEEDILRNKISKKEVYAHQTLNQLDYGKLIFTENSKVYANLNHTAIGSIKDDLFELTLKEFKSGKSWRKIRPQLTQCKNCVYRLLCPSPSGYDYFLKTQSLCNLSDQDKGILETKKFK